jgi:hypothetical protein
MRPSFTPTPHGSGRATAQAHGCRCPKSSRPCGPQPVLGPRHRCPLPGGGSPRSGGSRAGGYPAPKPHGQGSNVAAEVRLEPDRPGGRRKQQRRVDRSEPASPRNNCRLVPDREPAGVCRAAQVERLPVTGRSRVQVSLRRLRPPGRALYGRSCGVGVNGRPRPPPASPRRPHSCGLVGCHFPIAARVGRVSAVARRPALGGSGETASETVAEGVDAASWPHSRSRRVASESAERTQTRPLPVTADPAEAKRPTVRLARRADPCRAPGCAERGPTLRPVAVIRGSPTLYQRAAVRRSARPAAVTAKPISAMSAS